MEEDLELFPEHVRGIYDQNRDTQLLSMAFFRRALCIDINLPIQRVIDCGLVPRFMDLLQQEENVTLQLEAAWALTNISAGTSDHTRVVKDAGAVPVFVKLLQSTNDDLKEQAAWALGNIAGDSTEGRDVVLAHGALPALITAFSEHSRLSGLRTATWTISNLCKGKPAPPVEVVQPVLPLLGRLIFSDDDEVTTDACWSISYISDGSVENIQSVIVSGVCSRLVELLDHPSGTLRTPALRSLGNIFVTGSEEQSQMVINANVVPKLVQFLDDPQRRIAKEACWTLSNIAAGNSEQIQSLIEGQVFPRLVQLYAEGQFEVVKEATWAVCNALDRATSEQLSYIIEQRVIGPLCTMLNAGEGRIVQVALEGLEKILRKAKVNPSAGLDSGSVMDEIVEAGGREQIHGLQAHEMEAVALKATEILEEYFGRRVKSASKGATAIHQ